MVDTCASTSCTSAACPVCEVVLPFAEINSHIDACLVSKVGEVTDRQDREGTSSSRPLLKSPSGARNGRQAVLPFGGQKRQLSSVFDEPNSKSRKTDHPFTVMDGRSLQPITLTR